MVGIRDVPNRRITRGFALAPLDDALFNSRVDYIANDANSFNFRYSFEDVKATDSSKLDPARSARVLTCKIYRIVFTRFKPPGQASFRRTSSTILVSASMILITRPTRRRREFNTHFRAFWTVRVSAFHRAGSKNVCNLPTRSI